MKKSLLLSLALGMGLMANAEVVRTQVTSADQLEAGKQYQIACYNEGWTAGPYMWVTSATATPSHTSNADEATIWTFDAADSSIASTCTLAGHSARFALKDNNGKYLFFPGNMSGNASMADTQSLNTTFDFGPVSIDNANANKVLTGKEVNANLFAFHFYNTSRSMCATAGAQSTGAFGCFTDNATTGMQLFYNALAAQWSTYYVIYEVTITDPRDSYTSTYATAKEHLQANVGTDLCEYGFSNGTTMAQWLAFSDELDALWTATTFDETAFLAKVAEINAAYAALTLNMPDAGTFLRLQMSAGAVSAAGRTGDYFLGNTRRLYDVVAKGNRYMTEWETEATPSTIFFYDGQHLINVEKGVYMSATDYNHLHPGSATLLEDGTLDNAISEIRFEPGHTSESGVYGLLTVASNNGIIRACHNHVLSAQSTGDGWSNLMVTNSCGSTESIAHNLTLSYVTTLPYAIGTEGATTIAAPVDLKVPAGVEAYVATAASDVLTLAKVDVIPAGTAALLVGTPGVYSFEWAPAAAAADEEAEAAAATGVYAQQIIDIRNAAEGNVLLALTGYADGKAQFTAIENGVMPPHCMIIEAKADALTDGVLTVAVADGATTNLVYVDPTPEPVEPTYVRMDRTDWSVTGCSEYGHANNSSDGSFTDIFDGDESTYWHSHWANDKAAAGHFFIVDLGKSEKVAGIGYLPRSATNGNGFVQDAAVYLVDDVTAIACGENGTSHTSLNTFLADKTPAWTGNLKSAHTNPAVECTAYFDAEAEGRYLVFQILSTIGEENNWANGGNLHANCAEFYTYALEAAEPVEPQPTEGQEYTWEYTFTSKNDLNADGSEKELNGAMWGFNTAVDQLYFDNTASTMKGIQFGTGSKPVGKDGEPFIVTGSTFANAIKVTKVEVRASGATSVAATLGVKIGDTAFTVEGTEGDETVDLTKTATDYVWTGDATGAVNLVFNQTSSKALYIKTIKVTYVATKEIKAREVEDVEYNDIAALIEANNDFDNVILKNPVTVVFQNNRNLFVQDATGAMQIFGDLGVTLTAGQTLTGVKGKYTIYNTYTPEITDVVADSYTVAEGELPVPTTLSAALTTADANKYVKVVGATVATGETIVATVGDVEYTLINAYNIEGVEDGENITLTGIVNVTNTGLARIYLLSYEAVEPSHFNAFSIKGGTAAGWQTVRIDDSILGEHTPGVVDDSDLRTRNFTYSAWVRPMGEGTIMGMKPDEFRVNQGVFRIYAAGGKLSWTGRQAAESKTDYQGFDDTGLCDFEPNQWMFLTVVADQEAHTATLYKNGHAISTIETGYGIGLLPDNTITMYLADDRIDMDVEQVQVWTKALTPAEVRESYFMNAESTVPDELAGFYIVTNDDVKMTNLGKSNVDATVDTYKNTTLWGWLNTEEKLASAMFTVDVEGHTPAEVTIAIEQPEHATISVTPAAEGAMPIFTEVTVDVEVEEGYEAELTLTTIYGTETITAGEKVVIDADATISAVVTEKPETHYYIVSVFANNSHYTVNLVGEDETDFGFTEGSKVTVQLTAVHDHARALNLMDGENEVTLTEAPEGAAHHYEYVIDAIDRDIDLVLNSALYFTVEVNTNAEQFTYEFVEPAPEYVEGSEVIILFDRKNDLAKIVSLTQNGADVTSALVGYDDDPGVYEYTISNLSEDVVLTLISDIEDGINGIMINDGNEVRIYDLQGRRLNKTAAGNVYIINGQKVRI